MREKLGRAPPNTRTHSTAFASLRSARQRLMPPLGRPVGPRGIERVVSQARCVISALSRGRQRRCKSMIHFRGIKTGPSRKLISMNGLAGVSGGESNTLPAIRRNARGLSAAPLGH